MKSFRFRLKKIQKLRKDREKQHQKALAQARRDEAAERAKLQQLTSEASLRRSASRVTRQGPVDPPGLRAASDYIRQLDFLIKHQRIRVEKSYSRTEECRKKLEAASREVKKLERLEEIKKSQHDEAIAAFMQKENDEIASNIGRDRVRPAESIITS